MSTNEKIRSECAKDSASDNGASKKASAERRKDGNGKASEFQVRPESATAEQDVEILNEQVGGRRGKAGQLAPSADTAMSSGTKPRGGRAKNSASDVRAAVRFDLLADDASHEQREVYIKKHAVAVKGVRRKELKHSWCIGREIPKVKAEKELNNNEADVYLKAEFGFGVRQGNSYEQLWRAFPTIEEMLKIVPKSASLSVAVDKARATINPDQETAPDCCPDDVNNGGENTGTPAESGAGGDLGEKRPAVDPPSPPNSGDELSTLRDDILHLVSEMGKEHIPVLRKIHGLVTKAVDSKNDGASGIESDASNGKSKRRKAN